ncbi:MAG: acyl-CoA thioesterase [Pirellulales bacterium]|nr:acyl-CoA thioesterase [Pirellulales bacterium]
MSEVYSTQRRVEWHDTDAAGIAHFTAFFRYMEEAEHELLRSRGLSVLMRDDLGQQLSWPRVAVHCDYTGSVKFEDLLDIEVQIARLGTKSVTYDFRFRHGAREVARGTITAVCCRITETGGIEAIAISADIARRLGGPFD